MANLPYISPELLQSYQKEISSQTSAATSKRKMASLKKFFGWAKTEGHIVQNPIEAIAPLPQPPVNAAPKKPLKISNLVKIGSLLGMAVLVFLLVGRVKIPIPFRLAPASEPTASLFPITNPTTVPSSVTVTPTPTPAPSIREEIDPIFSKIYKDGVLTLEGASPALKAIGGLLIEASSLAFKTENNTDGDIEIAPDGSGIAHFLFEGTGQNFLNAQAPNLTSGSLYYGIVANNSTGYNLLKLQSGSSPTTRFSVDALGNTYLGGNITIGNNLIIGGATRFTNMGRLTSITGYYQDSGLFQIDQGGPDYAKITKDGVSSTADAVTFKLDETGQTASNYDTLVLSRLNGGSDAYALLVDEGNSAFDGNAIFNAQLELGRFGSNPTAIGQGSLIFNTTDLNTYVWNGTSWEDLTAAGGSTSFTDITSGTNITAAMVVGTGASLTYSGTGTITASDLTCTDCLDFTEFADSLTLDGATDIALGALTLSTSGTGALSFASTGQVTFAGNVNATNGLDVTVADLTVGGANFSVAQATGNITTAGDIAVNGDTITSDGELTIDATSKVIIPDADTLESNDLTSAGTLSVTSTTTNTITLDSGTTGDVNVGTGANAKSITIGNVTTTTTVNLTKGATGNIVLTGFDCTSPTYTNGGALTTDASGNITCSDDNSGAGSTVWSDLDDPTASLTMDHTSTGQFTTTMNWTATGALSPWTFSLVNNAGAATAQNFVTIKNDVTTQTTDTNTESLLLLDNADTAGTGSTVVDAAILITNSGAITNGITTGIDASSAQIVNALSVGPNIILGTGATIDFSEFDVSPTTGSVTIDDDGNLGQISIDGTVLDIDSLIFAGAGTINTGAATTLTLDSGTTGAIDIGISADAKAITIGNSTTTTTLNLTKGATGNIVLTGFDCTSPGFTSGGVLTTDASGNVTCDDDDTGGAATNVPWSGLTDPTTFLTLAFDNGEDNTFSYIHSTGDHNAWTFNYSQVDDGAATDDFDAMTFNLSSESGDAGDTFDGVVINWTDGVANTVLDSALKIDNAEDTAATLTDAILITSSGAVGGITDAIDVSATNLNNAINAGANFVLFDALRAFEGATGTLTLEDTGGADMALFIDEGTTGRLAISDSLNVGGTSTEAYSRLGTSATSHSGAGNVDAASDLVINDDLEVDGTLWLDGGAIHNSAGTLTVQFTGTPTTTANQLTGSSWLVTNTTNLGWAALIVDQTKGTDGTTDVFAASASGSTVFRVNRDGGTFIIAGASPPSTLLTVGAGSGKIDVGTVDPVYNIGGTKYATYMAGMVGVKEETAGNVSTQEYVPGLGYRQLIDFKNMENGSDLWLFSKATNLKENLDKTVVLLTPSVNTKTWYSLDKQNYTLSIYSLRPTSVSYRLTAPRFDYTLWTNYNNNPGAEGFFIPDDGVTLSSSGEVTPDPSPSFQDFSIVETSSGYELKDKLGLAVDGFEAFASFIAANIKAGAIETRDLLAEKIVAPRVETALISPLPDESNVAVQIGKAKEDGTSGFGELIVQDATGSAVASIDTAGNASFEGQVKSDSLQVASEATVAGTLYANDIKSTTLDDIQTLLHRVEADQDLLAQAATWNPNTASSSGNLSYEQLSVNDLFVTGTLAASNLSLSSSLTLGSDFVIQGNSINTLSAPLEIESLAMAPIELMAGKVSIETNGDVAISGNLYVAGKIESTGLSIRSSSGEPDSASIDASGSGKFKSVTTDDLVVASSQTSDASSIVNGEITTNATVGQAVIPAGIPEITIRNPKITDYTLVYVTPTSSSSNHVLYVKSKAAGFFSVGFSDPLDADVSFNWWIVSISQ